VKRRTHQCCLTCQCPDPCGVEAPGNLPRELCTLAKGHQGDHEWREEHVDLNGRLKVTVVRWEAAQRVESNLPSGR